MLNLYNAFSLNVVVQIIIEHIVKQKIIALTKNEYLFSFLTVSVNINIQPIKRKSEPNEFV